MTIPGLSLIDKMLAGLPDNARLRSELTSLRAEMEVLAKENQTLRAQLGQYETAPKIPAEALKILKGVFNEDCQFNAESIASFYELHPSMARYHIDALHQADLIERCDDLDSILGQKPRYRISSDGRSYLIQNGLA